MGDYSSETEGRRSYGDIVGKKMLVAGLVISACPFLIPPLLIGFVFCVPCGVLLASYACTRRIMSILLPVPVPFSSSWEWDHNIHAKDDQPIQLGHDEDDHKVEIELEEEDFDGESIPLEKVADGTAQEKPAVKEQEHSDDVAVPLPPATDTETRKDDVDESQKQSDGDKSSATSETPAGSDESSEQEKRAQITSATATDETNAKPESAPAPPPQQGAPESQISAKSNTAESSDKASKTWEQIKAVRAIVGYTARLKSTCTEEVKALYLFTGVQPPASDQSEFAEVDHQLHFLMSIIGVK